MRERILEGAFHLFYTYGLKSVTMDDIARHLNISKRTMYEQFENKNEIIKIFMLTKLSNNKEDLAVISAKSKDAVDEIIGLLNYFSEMFSKMNPTVVYDMQKYYPDCWQIFKTFKEQDMLNMIESNLNRGISEGVFRADLNLKIISKLRVEQVGMIFNPLVFPPNEFEIIELHTTILELFLRGIVSDEGYKLIKTYQINQK